MLFWCVLCNIFDSNSKLPLGTFASLLHFLFSLVLSTLFSIFATYVIVYVGSIILMFELKKFDVLNPKFSSIINPQFAFVMVILFSLGTLIFTRSRYMPIWHAHFFACTILIDNFLLCLCKGISCAWLKGSLGNTPPKQLCSLLGHFFVIMPQQCMSIAILLHHL